VTVEVRDARPADADAIADLHVRAWRVGYRDVVPDQVLDHPDLEQRRHGQWNHRLTHGPPPGGDPDNRIFAAVVRERVVGFGHAGREAEPPRGGELRGEIYGFYVHPDAWGTGVADALMAACLAELRSRFASAVLWTLRDTPRSRRFYERTGWRLQTTDDGTPVEAPFPLDHFPGGESVTGPLTSVQYLIDLV
jgi:GNAT superfamily N-acetyltransferase